MKSLPILELLFELRFIKYLPITNNSSETKTVNIQNDVCIWNVHVIVANCVKTSDTKSESETKQVTWNNI